MACTRDDVQDATGQRTFISGRGHMRAWPGQANAGDYTPSTGVPSNGKRGYAKGCVWQNFLSAGGTELYVNTGTEASSVWKLLLVDSDTVSALTVRCTTQQDATTNTTLANVPGLSVTLAAGQAYTFHGKLFTVSTANGGLKIGFGGTATATSIIAEGKINNGTTNNTSTQVTSLGTLVNALVASDSVLVWGSLVVNAAGTLTIQVAQNTSHADTSSVKVGSFMNFVAVL